MNNYQWCDDKGRYIPHVVCEKNISEGKCKKTKNGCEKVRKFKLSTAERKKRSRRIKKILKKKSAERAETEATPLESVGEGEAIEAK